MRCQGLFEQFHLRFEVAHRLGRAAQVARESHLFDWRRERRGGRRSQVAFRRKIFHLLSMLSNRSANPPIDSAGPKNNSRPGRMA